MVAQALDIARETYLAILMDRAHSGPVMVGSPYGGMDIEEVAAKDPNAIFTVRIYHIIYMTPVLRVFYYELILFSVKLTKC